MHSDNSYRTTPQVPLHSGFGPHTAAREVLRGHDLMGKTAIVTGGYSGIGLETTRALAEAGATVIVPARTPEKARASMSGMPRVELEEMDLINPASVDACAQRVLHSGRALHMLPSSLPKPFPRSSPQGTREALPSPILRRLSSTSQSRAAPRYAVLPGRSAAARWGRRTRRGQGVAAGVVAPKGRLNFLSA